MTTQHYAVIGNPIAHSKSPLIHTLFARQLNHDLSYRTILADIDGFSEAVDRFRAELGQGLNITVPFKQQAWAYADIRTARADRAGAVNTLIFSNRKAFGDNTDGLGLVRDLTLNHGLELAAKDILLLGAGGAARGAVHPLLAERPRRLFIANRTAAKAVDLANLFSDAGPVSGGSYSDLHDQNFDIIINSTSASLNDEVPAIPAASLALNGCCYDMVYADSPTAFVRWGRQHGARQALDGLGMLVEQAAESFLLWRGTRPDTNPVIAKLRSSMIAE